MTDFDPWVYGEIDPDDCHLYDCQQPSREIDSFVAVVVYDGVAVPMHIQCALLFTESVRKKFVQEDCKDNARWN